MKIKVLLFLLVLATSCASNHFLIDSKTDVYVNQVLKKQVYKTFDLKATIEFKENYRADKTEWVGFIVNSGNSNPLHGTDQGYLCFIRENGEVGIHTSIRNEDIRVDTFFEIYPDKNTIRITFDGTVLKFYVNDTLAFAEKPLHLKSGYINCNAGGAKAEITELKITPFYY
jgi:hypothetical protein